MGVIKGVLREELENSLRMKDNYEKHHIPVPFTLPELMALYFSTDMLKIFKDTAFYDSLESLSQKVKTTLPLNHLNMSRTLNRPSRYVIPVLLFRVVIS